MVVLVILRGEEEKSFIESRREKRRDERMKICGAFGWKRVTTVVVREVFSKNLSLVMILNLKGLSGPQTNTFYTSALLRKTKTASSKTYAPARWSPSLMYGAREIFSISKPLGLRTFSYKSLQPYSQAAVGVATSSFSEGGRRVPSSSSVSYTHLTLPTKRIV